MQIGLGVRAFQVRNITADDGEHHPAFCAIRKDNTSEDFSYLKCLQSMFPGDVSVHTNPYAVNVVCTVCM